MTLWSAMFLAITSSAAFVLSPTQTAVSHRRATLDFTATFTVVTRVCPRLCPQDGGGERVAPSEDP